MPVSRTADGQDVVPQLVTRVVGCGDKRCVAGHLRWFDGGMPWPALGASGDCLEDGGVAAPRAADDDPLGIGGATIAAMTRPRPGADSAGLGTHLDPGTLDLWMTKAVSGSTT